MAKQGGTQGTKWTEEEYEKAGWQRINLRLRAEVAAALARLQKHRKGADAPREPSAAQVISDLILEADSSRRTKSKR